MNTRLSIKNFRVFDKKGVDVEIAPLTFLIGCNSSGKSSIVKALTLLNTLLKQDFDSNNPVLGSTIDFSIKPNNTLGSFKNVVNNKTRKKEFTISYSVHSNYVEDDVIVYLTIEEGDLGNGAVKEIQIKSTNGAVILSADKNDHKITGDLRYLRTAFAQYLAATRFEHYRLHAYHETFFPDEELRPIYSEEEIQKYYQEALQYCNPDYLKGVYTGKIKIEPYKTSDKIEKAIDKYLETGIMTYFSIFDEMKGLKDLEGIRQFFESKVEEKDKKELLLKGIDKICNDYCSHNKKDFLSYYIELEETELLNPNSSLSTYNVLHKLCHKLYNDESYSIWNATISVDPYIYSQRFEKALEEPVDYNFVLNTLVHLSGTLDTGNDTYYTIGLDSLMGTDEYVHPFFYNTFQEYLNHLFDEITQDITRDIDYLSSTRIQVRRMYPMEDRNDFTDAVKRYYNTRNLFLTTQKDSKNGMVESVWIDNFGQHKQIVPDFIPGSFINKWMKEFKIGDHMTLDMDDNNLGLLLLLYKDDNDKKGRLLADLGYGITQLFSLLLQIEEMIMSSLYIRYKKHVDYIAPRTLAIEEPEIHLHPNYQSKLVEVFLEAYKEYNIHFIIETHSEYLIRKVQTYVGSKLLSPEEVSITYVEDDDLIKKNGEKGVLLKKARRIAIEEDGRLSEPFGTGFFDEADSLAMKLLRIKSGLK